MDHDLRTIERRARLGDAAAAAALERAWLRSGLGWHGERVPERMLVGVLRGLYLWWPGAGYRIEMSWIGRVRDDSVWVSRRPLTAALLRTFFRATGRVALEGERVPYAVAKAYALWAGASVPRRRELVLAGHEGEASWYAERGGAPAWEARPFHVVVRSRGS